jgi:hypothetical protein
MDENFTLRISLVLDRRVDPLVGELCGMATNASSNDMRVFASRLRALRPAWRAIDMVSCEGRHVDAPRPELHRADGSMLRLDAYVVSRQPLILAAPYSAEDARVKLEALSCAYGADIRSIETQVYRTALACDMRLHRVSPWREPWYCICGVPSLDDVLRCPRCGRPRDAEFTDGQRSQIAA